MRRTVDVNVVFWVDDPSVRSSGSDRARFDQDKSAMCAIKRIVWRFVELGGIVADSGSTVGYARLFAAGVGGWMTGQNE